MIHVREDNQKMPQGQRELSVAERKAYCRALAALGANRACARCGSLSASMGQKYFYLSTGIGNSSEDEYLMCVSVACKNCGHIDLYSAVTLLEKDKELRSKPPKP